MQGRILELDSMGAGGTILGNDGSRYAFVIGEWRAAEKAAAGMAVDFVLGDNTTAREIFPLPGQSAAGQPAAQPWASAASAASSSAAASPGVAPPTVYVPPPAQSQSTGGSSVVLGLIGLVFLVGGYFAPFIPFGPGLVALVFGLVGADSGKRHRNTAGLVLSRISWIGALVLLLLQIALIGFAVSILALMFGIDTGKWTIV